MTAIKEDKHCVRNPNTTPKKNEREKIKLFVLKIEKKVRARMK